MMDFTNTDFLNTGINWLNNASMWLTNMDMGSFMMVIAMVLGIFTIIFAFTQIGKDRV
jgi:hypothetical protein